MLYTARHISTRHDPMYYSSHNLTCPSASTKSNPVISSSSSPSPPSNNHSLFLSFFFSLSNLLSSFRVNSTS